MSIIDLQRRVSRLVPPDSPAERYAEMERIAALLTPDQRMQAADLRARIDEVGIEGLTDEEHAIAAEIRAALLGTEGQDL